MNIPVHNPYQQTLFISKPVGTEYTYLRNRFHEIIIVEKLGYNECFGEGSFGWYVNEMLKIESYMTHNFGNMAKLSPGTLYDSQKSVGYLIKISKWMVKERENLAVEDDCHLTGKFRGVAQKEYNFGTTPTYIKHASFVPIFSLDLSRYGCHLIFRKVFSVALETFNEIKGEDIIAESSEKIFFLKIGGLCFLASYRLLKAGLDDIAATKPPLSNLDG